MPAAFFRTPSTRIFSVKYFRFLCSYCRLSILILFNVSLLYILIFHMLVSLLYVYENCFRYYCKDGFKVVRDVELPAFFTKELQPVMTVFKFKESHRASILWNSAECKTHQKKMNAIRLQWGHCENIINLILLFDCEESNVPFFII